MSVFEAIMLICFGISWPMSILKSVRTKVVTGKSPVFMVIVCLGYASGVVHKLLYHLDPIIVLYVMNMVFVAVDLCLYFHYLPRSQAVAAVGAAGQSAQAEA